MECIFLSEGKNCTAHLPQFAPTSWEIDEETLKQYCKTKDFDACPRYSAYMKYNERE